VYGLFYMTLGGHLVYSFPWGEIVFVHLYMNLGGHALFVYGFEGGTTFRNMGVGKQHRLLGHFNTQTSFTLVY
jgi:hypothetical protein